MAALPRLLRLLVPPILLGLGAFSLGATTYYWNSGSTASEYWNTHLSQWKTATAGGTSLAAFASGDVFNSNGRSVATELSASTFGLGAGVTLVLNGGVADQLSMKAIGADVATLPALVSDGGIIGTARADNSVHRLTIVSFHARAGTTLLNSAEDVKNRTMYLTVNTLFGPGALGMHANSGDGRNIYLTIGDATGYTGNFAFGKSNVIFQNAVQSGGSLTLSGTGRLTLDQHVTFAEVTIGGVGLGAGTHSFAELNAAFDAYFVDGGSGSITVAAGGSLPDSEPLGVRPGLRLTADTSVDSGLTFATGTYGVSLNGQTFQQEGLVSFNGYQYAAYWNINKRPAVARRALPNGPWETIVFNDYGPISHTDVHNVNVIGISPDDGSIHLAFDHHVHNLHYRKTIAGVATNPAAHAWTQSLFGSVTDDLVPATNNINSVTYPLFFSTPQNKLQFAYRNGSSGNGDWFLYEYSNGTWVYIGMIFSKAGTYSGKTTRSAYPDQFRYDDNGRLHVTWVWRENGSNLTGNHDLNYAYSDDFGRTWKNNAGTTIATPISITTPGILVYPITYLRGLMNTTTLYLDRLNQPHVVAWHMPVEATSSSLDMNLWRYYHYWRDVAGTWHRQLLPFHGRKPQVVFSKTGNMHVVYGHTEDATYEGTEAAEYLGIATATEAGNWEDWLVQPFASSRRFLGELLLDMGRWRREETLSVYFQEMPGVPAAAAPLRVLDFQPVKRQLLLAELPYSVSSGLVRKDTNYAGLPMQLNIVPFPRGLGLGVQGELTFDLEQKYTRFLADTGLDDFGGTGTATVFEVWADGVKIYDSGSVTGASANQALDLDVAGIDELRLVTSSTGVNYANWGNARLLEKSTPFESWQETAFPGVIDPAIYGEEADPEGDGATNVEEYAFGMLPGVPGELHRRPAFSTAKVLGLDYPVISFRRRIAADPGITYEILESSDLEDWEPVNMDNHLVGAPVNLGDGFELVTVRGSQSITGPGSSYLRARIQAIR